MSNKENHSEQYTHGGYVMARRFSGSLRVVVYERDGLYHGVVHIPQRGNWLFNDLKMPHYGDSHSPEAYDHAAENALAFGSYYASDNRGDDVPAWAPTPEIADAICMDMEYRPDEAKKYPVIQGVYIGDTAVVARSTEAMERYYNAHDAYLAKKAPVKLRLVLGGKGRDAA